MVPAPSIKKKPTLFLEPTFRYHATSVQRQGEAMVRPTYDHTTIAAYERDAENYDERTADYWRRFPKTLPQEFIRRMGARRSVLDIGCGPGRDGQMLEEMGCRVLGIDMSRAMLRIAAQRGLMVCKADMFSLPLAEGSVDGVWAYTSLLHSKKEHLSEALAEIHRILRPEGLLALGMHQGDEHRYRIVGGVSGPRWFSHYEQSELDRVLELAGFTQEFFEEIVPGRNTTYLHYVLRKRDR